MKTTNNYLGIMMLSAVLGLVSCSESSVDPAYELTEKSATIGLPTVFPELVSAEEPGILQVREEEKMAQDVYANFYSLWKLPVFEYVSIAETNHFDAVYTLIEAYQLTDPSTGVAGTFTNAAIAELYAQLIKKGSVSVQEALLTGGYIEETDILYLEKLMAETENPAVQQIYGNLLRGSRNHLRAFVSTLPAYNLEYTPQLMDPEVFNTIINSPMESGSRNGMNNGNGQGKGKNNGTGNGNSGNGNSSSRGTGTGTGVCING